MKIEVKRLVTQASTQCFGCGAYCFVVKKNMKQIYASLKKEGWRYLRKKGWGCPACIKKKV